MTATQVYASLRLQPKQWLLTGAAGFIGSHMLEALLQLGQSVVALDDLSTGSWTNLERVRSAVSDHDWRRCRFVRASVLDPGACCAAMKGSEIVLHLAGFASVGLSVTFPSACREINVTGTLNLLHAARSVGVRRFVLASSCAVYGDDVQSAKREETIGSSLSPYAASKRMAEAYVELFAARNNVSALALRYFNVFGPAQSVSGPHAPVIPQWITRILCGEKCLLHGSGLQTRDFLCVTDVVYANLLASVVSSERLKHRIYNIGSGVATDLKQLYILLAETVARYCPEKKVPSLHRDRERAGDVLHAVADISRAREDLGYEPVDHLEEALARTVKWFAAQGHDRSGRARGGRAEMRIR